MNKTSLLLVALALGAQSVHGYTNKTYLQPRNQGLVNLPMEMTTYQERLGHRCQTKHGFGGFGEDTFFYGQSNNKHALGRYFGAHTNDMTIVKSGLVSGDESDLNATPGTLDIGYIIHDNVFAASGQEVQEPDAVGTNWFANSPTSIKINPESTHYGFDFVYYQDLSKVLKGVYFKINMPVQYVENDPKLDVTQTGSALTSGDIATKENIYRYFAGDTIIGQSINDRQAQLMAGKINGEKSATGLADVDMMLGYNFLRKEKYNADISIALSLPVGNKPTGEYLFEPVYGTRHVGLGGGINADARIWGTDCHHIKINFKSNYRYLFQASEMRLLGLKDKQWGQYALLASADDSDNTRSVLTPAANILNQFCDVTQGSQFDAMLGLSYKKCGFSMDLGYNFYARERERVKSQCFIPGKTYVLAARSLDITNNDVAGVAGDTNTITNSAFNPLAFGANSAIADGTTVVAATNVVNQSAMPDSSYLSQDDVDTDAAATPAQVTNSIYAGAGYLFKAYGYPTLVGIGGKYEFAANNNVLEVWQFWAKVGVNF